MSKPENEKYKIDVAIIGAGIAGLWLLHRLKQQGYSAVLLENAEIGGGQTILSQGIIHGGTKYALNGKLSEAAQTVAQMTSVWHGCLSGQGVIDLSQVKILSDHHYMWMRGRYTGRLKGLISKKVLSSQSELCDSGNLPQGLSHPDFRGSVCALDEVVLDVPSLVDALASPYRDCILKSDDRTCYQFNDLGELAEIQLHREDNESLIISPNHTVFTAGNGAEKLMKSMLRHPTMQRRPLHMVVAKSPDLPALFLHVIEKGTKPALTITSHVSADGTPVWYLGGDLAETGVGHDTKQQIARARNLCQKFFPWLLFDKVDWHSFMIDRAELAQPGRKRPDNYTFETIANVTVAWPTKLTLAPALAEAVIKKMPESEYSQPDLPDWMQPPFAAVPWV